MLAPCVHACKVPSVLSDSATLWTVVHQVPLSMIFSRQEYWSGLPCPYPGALPNPGIKPMSLTSPALAGKFFTTSTTWEALNASALPPAQEASVGFEQERSLVKPGLWKDYQKEIPHARRKNFSLFLIIRTFIA